MEEENPTEVLDKEEKKEAEDKLSLGESTELVDMTEKEYEMTIPDTVIEFLKVKAGDKLHFILDESDKKIYVEKTQKEEKKAEDFDMPNPMKEDYYTRHERLMKEEFEPGSVNIEKIDSEWNIQLPDNILSALGLIEGDHVRFEAVDRETFKISKIR